MELYPNMQDILDKNPFVRKTELVYTLLLDGILAGHLVGGQKINQEEISAQLGISRSPVRDALNRLNAEGYLVKEGASGYYIYQLKMEDYLTINEFRSMLEVFSVELAARNITHAQLEELRRNVKETRRAVKENDIRAFSRLDSEFHELLVRASQNPMILKTYEEHAQRFHLFRILTLSEDMMATALRWHEKIFRAIEEGDEAAAVRATRTHRDNTISGALVMCKKRQGTA